MAKRLTDPIIIALGGTSAIGRMMQAPPSTVHSWRKRISPARLNHLIMVANNQGKVVPWHELADTENRAA
jgi:hypothetical protein